jgi:hypothetical protein
MQKFFRLISDAGIIEMPADSKEEAEAKARKALPSITSISSVEEMSDIEVAESKISALKHEIAVMGANDYEFPAIEGILRALKAGEISPDDAVSQVYEIRASKQDYH